MEGAKHKGKCQKRTRLISSSVDVFVKAQEMESHGGGMSLHARVRPRPACHTSAAVKLTVGRMMFQSTGSVVVVCA